MTQSTLTGISSMATRQILAELARLWQLRGGAPVQIESVGGVDAAKRVSAGEGFDLVFLATNALEKLEAEGKIVPGSRRALASSSVGVAVPAGAVRPDISSEAAVRAAVLAAPTIGYSTGPSGVALQKLFERWGIAEQIQPRIVQAQPGIPVASLVAQGQVALGFQQLSEIIHVPGIDLLGLLPQEIAITTVFGGAVAAASGQQAAAAQALAFMASPEAAQAKRDEGMEPCENQ